jgi:hypothetical protein
MASVEYADVSELSLRPYLGSITPRRIRYTSIPASARHIEGISIGSSLSFLALSTWRIIFRNPDGVTWQGVALVDETKP